MRPLHSIGTFVVTVEQKLLPHQVAVRLRQVEQRFDKHPPKPRTFRTLSPAPSPFTSCAIDKAKPNRTLTSHALRSRSRWHSIDKPGLFRLEPWFAMQTN